MFYTVGDGIRSPYAGILGQDFIVSKRAKTDYKKIEIIMGDVRLQSDDKVSTDEMGKPVSIILKARCETVVKVPIKSEELKVRLISKTELLPGVMMAKTLTVVRERGCLTSILNMNDEDVSLSIPLVNLEEVEDKAIEVDMFLYKER
jgi:hypothetical protein